MRKQSGLLTVQTAIAIAVTLSVVILSVTKTGKIVQNIVKKQELKLFIDDLFIASKLHFFNEVNNNGSCFTYVPASIQVGVLISNDLLDDKYASQSFFNPTLTTVSFRAASSSGLVETIDVTVPLNESARQRYSDLPYFTYGDEDEVRFSRKIEYRKTGSFLANLNSSFCHG